MRLYFAHSFGSQLDAAPLRSSGDPLLLSFLASVTDIGVTIVDPAEIRVEDPSTRFEYCLTQIRDSDALVVDARKRLGLGVGAEMMYAQTCGVPVFTVAPPATYYRNRIPSGGERVHAFVKGLSTELFASFDDCIDRLKQIAKRGKANVRRGI